MTDKVKEYFQKQIELKEIQKIEDDLLDEMDILWQFLSTEEIAYIDQKNRENSK